MAYCSPTRRCLVLLFLNTTETPIALLVFVTCNCSKERGMLDEASEGGARLYGYLAIHSKTTLNFNKNLECPPSGKHKCLKLKGLSDI